MELPSSKSISDRSDMKPSFRKPSSEVASRKYRRHSPSARSDSSSSGGGSPRRERSRSPQHSKEDHSRISDDHRRKDPGREIERESTRSRSNRVHDSHKYSEKHPYNNFNDYRRRDDYSRHDRHVDEENRNYKWSSRSARNDNHSDYTRSERTSDRYRDNWRKVDEHSRDRNENSEHRSKNKEKVCMKDYDKIDAGKKQVGLSRDYDPDHDHHRDREFRDRIRSYRRSPTSEDMDKSSEKDIHAEDMILKRKPHEKEGNQHKEKYASKREVIQDERRSLFSSREIDGKKEKKVDEVSDMIDKNSSSRELKAGNLERDDEQLSSSRQVNSTNVEAKHDSVNPNTNNIEGTGDVNSAKDAAMKAAELVNRNLVGFGGVGFLSADQKKKLLWGNKKNNSTEESSSCWDLHLFPDQERQEKFNRLMSLRLPFWLWSIVGCEGQCGSGPQSNQGWRPPSKEKGGTRHRLGEAVYCWPSSKRWSNRWSWTVMISLSSLSVFRCITNNHGEKLDELAFHYVRKCHCLLSNHCKCFLVFISLVPERKEDERETFSTVGTADPW